MGFRRHTGASGWTAFALSVLASLVAGFLLMAFTSEGCQGRRWVHVEWGAESGDSRAAP